MGAVSRACCRLSLLVALGVLVGSGLTMPSIGLLYGMDGTSICGTGLRLFLLGVVFIGFVGG